MSDSSYKIEVHMISNRPNLDFFIQMWDSVIIDKDIDATIKVMMLDYPEKKFVLENGIKVEYIKQRTSWKTTFMNQSYARNELLCYSSIDKTKYVLFFDDWQRPDKNILIEHIKHLKIGYVGVCGRRFECDKDGNNCKEDYRNNNRDYVRQCGYGEFWCCNASTRFESILAINGFDNRYAGGTAGEDYDLGMRLTRIIGAGAGFGMAYNPNAISYHYCHDHLGRVPKDNVDGHSHNTSDYKYIPEYKHFGKWDNMDGKDKYEFWWEGPVKYYKCKICGDIGILDSMQVYYHNRDHNVIRCENGLEQVREALKKVIG